MQTYKTCSEWAPVLAAERPPMKTRFERLRHIADAFEETDHVLIGVDDLQRLLAAVQHLKVVTGPLTSTPDVARAKVLLKEFE